MSAPIEVLDVRRVETGGNVRAYLSIRIGSVTLHGCKIVQQPGQRPWLAMPDRQWQGADGKTRYTPMVELAGELKKRVSDTVLNTWEGRDGRVA